MKTYIITIAHGNKTTTFEKLVSAKTAEKHMAWCKKQGYSYTTDHSIFGKGENRTVLVKWF